MSNTPNQKKNEKPFPGFMKNLRKLKNKIRGSQDDLKESEERKPEPQKSGLKKKNVKQRQARTVSATPPANSRYDQRREREKEEERKRENRKEKEKEKENIQQSKINKKTKIARKKVAETPKEVPETVTDKFNFIGGMLAKEVSGIRKEFNDFKAEDRLRFPVATVCQELENLPKNRYKNILCLDASRVRLSDGGYYHANAVDSRFILAQSPLPNTVEHFWDLVQAEAVEAIVQLYPCDDGKRCAKYYPPQVGESADFGAFKVMNSKIDPSPVDEPTLLFSHLKVQGPKGEMKIKHVFWSGFPPTGFPEPSNTIPYIWKEIKGFKKVLVHCSSGAGRSAVVVLTCQMLERIHQTVEMDAIKMLKELREKRHCAIRNEMQYVYVMRIILFYFMKYNAVEMSQNLLIFLDDYDAYDKKYGKEEKERKEKSPNPPPTDPTDEFQNFI
ncbi:unnamed protein product [Bursaphelenchus xylophilus]|uniref:(pine wood nematode) hypothetical protein n=1 Tax=Bursaphelenchus xylophilus TaxID=6326 RepID=A0A1I7RU14_BURXY|nr:unnamed protein product [Bursaphelenchus xylophilus]CAG9132027.1 unnamed protein product [Bursaphelenchus xylophilus]